MGLSRRLEKWVREGLIDSETAERIEAYEATRRRPTALYALVGLGALAIGTGLVAIVAANWDAIPAVVKLGVDLLGGAALALSIERLHRRGGGWGVEALLLVYYLFVLASIGLMGQMYQLGTPLHVALGVWVLATLPLLFLAQSRFSAALWAAGLVTAYVWNAVEWVDRTDDAHRVDLALSLAVALPVLLLFLSWALRLTSDKVARTFREVAWGTAVVLTFVGSFLWYATVEAENLVTWGAGAALALAALPIVLRRPLFGEHATMGAAGIGLVPAVLVPPLIVSHGDHETVGGLVGLIALALFALLAYRIGHRAAFSLLTAAIGIRIVTIYFEVFGSLMSTGVGLVTGGLLTLLVAWLWARTSSRLREDFENGGPGER